MLAKELAEYANLFILTERRENFNICTKNKTNKYICEGTSQLCMSFHTSRKTWKFQHLYKFSTPRKSRLLCYLYFVQLSSHWCINFKYNGTTFEQGNFSHGHSLLRHRIYVQKYTQFNNKTAFTKLSKQPFFTFSLLRDRKELFHETFFASQIKPRSYSLFSRSKCVTLPQYYRIIPLLVHSNSNYTSHSFTSLQRLLFYDFFSYWFIIENHKTSLATNEISLNSQQLEDFSLIKQRKPASVKGFF